MRNLRKVNKILFSTLLIFSIGVFANYSKTASKYLISDTSDRITNSIAFKSISRNFAPTYDPPGKEVVFKVPFYRTAADGDTSITQDVIRFETNSTCTIENVTGFVRNGSKNTYEIAGNVVTFTYHDAVSNSIDDIVRDEAGNPVLDSNKNIVFKDIPAETYVNIYYRCTAADILGTNDDGETVLKTTYKAYEKIDNEQPFRYFGGTYPTGKYVAPVGHSVTSDLTALTSTLTLVDPTAVLTESMLVELIEEFVKQYGSGVSITPTVKDALKYYLTFNAVKNNPDSIKGLVYNATNRTYTIDKTILSYAYTNFYKNTYSYTKLYFVNTNNIILGKSDVDDMFAYYYDTYYKPKFSADEYTKILKYINDKGGISSVVVDGKSIIGVPFMLSFVTIEKDIIQDQLNPSTPKTELDFSASVSVDSVTLPKIAAAVVRYVDDRMGIKNYDDISILADTYLYELLADIKNKSNSTPADNTSNYYYYLNVGDGKLLSLHLYYDTSDSKYYVYLSPFDTNNLDTSADVHVYGATNKLFRTLTSVADYATMRSQVMTYVQTIDNAYGTSFITDGAMAKFDAAVDILIGRVNASNVNDSTPLDITINGNNTIADTTNNYVMTFKYYTDADREGYGSFAIELAPVKESTTIAQAETASTTTTTTTTTTSTTTTKTTLTTITTAKALDTTTE